MASIDLCTLADVRLAMETKTGDVALDNLILARITDASRALIDEAQRELAPASASGVVRRIDVTSHHVDLVPYDLRAATLVQLDPDGSPVTLAPHVDYELLPIGGDKDGMYTRIRLSQFVSLQTGKMFAFGHADLAVTGSWGYATVPETAKNACIVAVRSWLRRDLATYASVAAAGGGPPQPYGTYALPAASCKLIARLMRYPAGSAP